MSKLPNHPIVNRHTWERDQRIAEAKKAASRAKNERHRRRYFAKLQERQIAEFRRNAEKEKQKEYDLWVEAQENSNKKRENLALLSIVFVIVATILLRYYS